MITTIFTAIVVGLIIGAGSAHPARKAEYRHRHDHRTGRSGLLRRVVADI